MKYFIDTEFEPTPPATPLSLAIVREDGEYDYWETEYATLEEDRFSTIFVRDNVLPHLYSRRIGVGKFTRFTDEYFTDVRLDDICVDENKIRRELVSFVGDDEKPEFYAWYGAQDWIFIIQLFGGQFSNMPKNWPGYYNELKVVCNNSVFTKEEILENVPKPKDSHFALADALWNKRLYEFLVGNQ